MKLMVFTVFDKAVSAFLPPFFARSRGEALRSFTEASNDRAHNFSKHAMDYVLMQLGEFDDGNGLFKCHEPERVVAAHECVVPEDPFTEETKVANVRKLPM